VFQTRDEVKGTTYFAFGGISYPMAPLKSTRGIWTPKHAVFSTMQFTRQSAMPELTKS